MRWDRVRWIGLHRLLGLLSLALWASGARAQFVSDTLSDTAGTNLTAHTGAVGATWSKNGASTGDFVFGASPGGVRLNTNGSIAAYYASGTPPSADYDVQADFNIQAAATQHLIARCDTAAQTWYLGGANGTSYAIYRFNAGTITQLATTTGFPSSGVHTVKLSVRGSGATVTITVYLDGAQALTVADTSGSRITSAGKAGLYSFVSGVPTDANTIHVSNFSAVTAPLSSGPITPASATATTINLSSAAGAFGTGPYAYQWYRSTVSGFTPGVGNLLSGQTALTLADSSALTAGTVYYYKLVTTDSLSAVATSAQFAASLWQSPVAVGWIGDSITFGFGLSAGQDPPTQAKSLLAALLGPRAVTISNRGASGSQTSQWVLGSGTNNLENALIAFAAAGVTHVHICLGANDAQTANLVTAATYQSNLSSICSTLIANGYKVILSAPPFFDITVPLAIRGDASLALIPQYQSAINSLVNGTTILRGDLTGAWTYFANNTSQFQADGVHPGAAGAQNLGTLWGYACAKAMGLTPSSGSGGGRRRIQ